MLRALLPLAILASAAATLLVTVRSGEHAPAVVPSFLKAELGKASPNAPLKRTPRAGVSVAIDGGGYRVERGRVALTLGGGEQGTWEPYAGGAVRATSFGSESISIGADKTELYATVTKRQGEKTWRWLLQTQRLTPRLDADGSVTLAAGAGDAGLRISPVKILTPAGKDVTPARARWSLRPDGGSTWLELRLDDARLPLPYVIDPAANYPTPLYFSSTTGGNTTAAGDWRLITTAPGAANVATTARFALSTTGYTAFVPGVATTATVVPSTTPTTTGWIVDVGPGTTGFVAGNWTFTLKSTNGGTNGGVARYTVSMWRGTLTGTAPNQVFGCANCGTTYTRAAPTGDLLVPLTDGTANIVAASPTTDTVTVAVPAFQLAANQTIWVQVWNHMTTGYTAGNNAARTVALSVNDGISLLGHPVADDVVPAITTRAVNGSTLTLTYNDTLDTDASSRPANGDYAVLVNGSARSVTNVAVSGSTSTLTLASAVQNRDVVTVAYTQGTNILKDDAMNNAASFTAAAATNSTANANPNVPGTLSPADAVRYSSLTPAFSAVFSDPDTQSTGTVNFRVCNDSACSSIRSSFNSSAGLANNATGNATYSGSALVNGTTYWWQSQNTDQDAGVSGWTPGTPRSFVPDTSAPTVSSRTVTGASLVVAYNESLAGAPANGDYTVLVNGSGRSVTNVSVAGSNATLTLASAVQNRDVVTVAYTGTALTDSAVPAGNQAATFGAAAATNSTANATPNVPGTLTPADAVRSSTLTPAFSAVFSDPDTQSTGQIDFRVCNNSDCSSVRSSFSSSAGLANNGTGNATYSGSALVDGTTYYWQARTTDQDAGSSAWTPGSPRSFVADTSAPTVSSRTVTGASLVVAYNESLAGAPANGDYTVTVNGSGRAVTGVSVVGSNATLTLTSAVRNGDTVTVAYSGSALTDTAAPTPNTAATFGAAAVTNSTANAAPTVPTSLSPADAVKLNTLTPAFSAVFGDLDTQNTGKVTFQVCNDSGCSSIRSTFDSTGGLAVGATGNATYSGSALVSGTTYYWQARNEDTGTLTSAWTPGSPRSFLVDTALPASVVSFPANSSSYRTAAWTGTLSGTASDTGGAGVASVDLSIQRTVGGLYWDPAAAAGAGSFSSAVQLWFAATGTASWSYSFPAAKFPADGNYTVFSRSTDAATNVQSPVTSSGFTYDTVAPTVSSRGVNGASLAIAYDEPLAGAPANGDYTVTVNGSGRAVTNVSVVASTATLTLASAVLNGDTVTVAYSGAALTDVAGNAAATFGAAAATNSTPNQNPSAAAQVSPADAARVNSTTPTLTATFSDPDTQNTGQINFRVCSDSGCSSVISTFSSSAGLANGANGSLAVPGGAGLTNGTTYYWQAQGQDQNGGTSAFSASRSLLVDTAAPTVSSRTVTGASLVVAYNESLAGAPANGDYTVTVNGSGRAVTGVSVVAANATLTLASAVQNRDVVTVAYTGSALTDTALPAGNGAATFGAAATTNSTANASPNAPGTLTPADAVRANSLTPAFSAVFSDPDTQSTGQIDFRVCNNSDCSSVRSSFSSSAGLANNGTGNANYSGAALVDGTTYYWQARTTDQDAGSSAWTPGSPRSFVADTSAPTVSTRTVTGATLVVAYNESLTGAPATSDYAVVVNGLSRSVTNVSVSGSDATLTLASAVRNGDTVTVAYTGTVLRDSALPTGNQAATFTATAATNATANGAPSTPALVTPTNAVTLATATPTLTATFDDLDTQNTGRVNFRVCTDSGCSSVVSTFSSGAGLATGANGSAAVPGAANLASGTTYFWQAQNEDAGSLTSAFSASRSFTVDTTAPTVSSRGVVGATLAVVYDEPLAGAPANGDYTVSVNGSGRAVTNVSVAGSTATLTLASAVLYADVVTVAYAGSALTDAVGNAAAGFGAAAATNTTSSVAPTTPALVTPAASAQLPSATPTLTATFADPDTNDTGRINFRVCADSGCSSVLSTFSSAAGIANGANASAPVPGGAGLAHGTTYYWQAQGEDAGALTSSFSASRSFSVDLVAPAVTTRAVDGAALTISYGETVSGSPANGDYTVSVNGSGRAVTNVSVSGTTAVLTLASATRNGDVVTVAYSGSAVVDGAGNAAATFGAAAVTNSTANVAPSAAALVSPANAAYTTATPTLAATFSDADTQNTGQVNFRVCADSGCSSVLSTFSSSAGIANGANGSAAVPGAANLADGVTYYWQAQNEDGGALTSAFSASRSLVVDITAPASAITFPANGGTYRTATWSGALSGTASDATSGVTLAEISIQQGSSGLYWDPAANAGAGGFANLTELYVTATGTTSWSFALAAAKLNTDGSYVVHARSTDAAGLTGGAASSTFTYDTVAPAVSARAVDGATLTISYVEPVSGAPANGDYTVSVNGSGNAVTNVSVSGSTATLTLTTAVRNGDTVTVAYTGSAIVDTAGNPAATFGATAATNTTANAAPSVPALVTPANAATTASATPTLTATFADLDTQNTGKVTFRVCSDSGCSSVISTFSSGTGLANGANGSAAVPGAANLTDGTYYWQARNEDAGALTSAYSASRSLLVDLTAPAVSTRSVDGATLTVTYVEPVSGAPANGDYTVSVNGSGNAVTNVSVSGSTATLTLTTAVRNGDTVTVAYTGSAIVDTAGNPANTFGATAATNTTANAAPSAPALVSPADNARLASTTPSLSATFTDLDTQNTGLVRFQVCTTSDCASPISTFTSSAGIANGANGSAAVPGAANLADGVTYYWRAQNQDAGGLTSSYTSTRAFTVDLTAPAVSSRTVDGVTLTIAYAEPVSGAPANGDYTVSVNGSGRAVTNVSVSGSNAVLTLASAVRADDVVTVAYAGTAIVDAAGNQAAGFAATGATNTTTNGLPNAAAQVSPANAAFLGTATPTLTATFSDDDTVQTGQADFRVCADGACSSVLSTFASSAGIANGANGSAAVPGAANLADGVTYHWQARGHDQYAAVSAWSASRSFTVDLTAPAVSSRSVDGATLTIAYAEPVSGAPANGDYTVTVNGSGRAVTNVSVSGSNAVLTLASAARNGDVVTVAYAGSAVVDRAANPAAGFGAAAVTNTTANVAPSAPAVVSPADAAFVPSTTPTLTATFADPDTQNTGKVTFQVCSDSGCSAVISTFSSATGIANGANGSAAVPGAASLADGVMYWWQARNEDENGGQSTYAPGSPRSFTVDLTAPAVSSRTVSGATLTIAYAEPVSGAPANGDYTVSVNGSGRAVTNVSVSGSNAVLTLTSAVLNGDVVTVTYAGSAVVDRATNPAAGFGAAAVTNGTPNQAPSVPALVSPANAAFLASTTPTLTATFADPDTQNTGKVNFRVCSDSGCTSVISTFSSAGGLANGANGSAPVPGGAGLVDGVTYFWQAQNEDGDASASAFSGSRSFTVDVTAPTVSSRTITGATLTIAYAEPVSGAPANGDYTVTVNGSGRAVTNVSVSGSNAVLTVASAVLNGDVVTVAYAGSAVVDRAGTAAAGFGAAAVTNTTANQLPSVPTSLSPAGGVRVDSTTPSLAATFADPDTLNTGRIDFEVCADSGCSSVISSFSSAAGLANGASGSAPVPGAAALANGVTYHWRATAVDVNSGASAATATRAFTVDTAAPAVLTRVIAGNLVVITYGETLAGAPATSDYAVVLNGSGNAVTNVSVSGAAVTLTVTTAATSGDTATVAYSGTALRDSALPTGNAAATFAATSADNQTSSVDPDVPALVTPAAAAFVSTATPTLTATFTDPDLFNTGQANFRVCSDSGCTSVISTFSSAAGIVNGANASAPVPGAASLADATTYYWQAQNQDNTTRTSAFSASRAFTVDLTRPASSVSVPAAAANLRTATWSGSISGSASDATAGVTGVDVSVRRVGDGLYWDPAANAGAGGFASAVELFVPASGTTSWSLAFAASRFSVDGQYTIASRANDAAGNAQTALGSATFTFDATAPTGAIAVPSAAAYRAASWSGTLSGSAADATSGVASVTVEVKRLSDNEYWNGSAWQAGQTALTASGTTSWSAPLAAAALTDGISYLLTETALDAAGNAQAVADTHTFVYDTTAPTSAVSSPAAGAYNATGWPGSIAGSAADAGSGIASVTVSVQSPSSLYWDPAANAGAGGFTSAIELYVTAAGTTSWSYALAAAKLDADGSYLVHSRSTDAAGNVQGLVTSRSFTYDATAPASTIAFPSAGGNYNAAGWTGTLGGAASDATSGVAAVAVEVKRLSDNQYWNGSTWQGGQTTVAATGTTSWSYGLAAGALADGVSFRISSTATDAAGNAQGAATTATFVYDTTAPTSSVATPAAGAFNAAGWPGTLAGAAADAASGVASVSLELSRSSDGRYWNGSSWQVGQVTFAAAGTTSWSSSLAAASLTDGASYTLSVVASDAAGNVQPAATTRAFSYDTTAPATTIGTKPTDPSTNTTPTFTFSSDEPGSTFRCDLDSGGFASCTSPKVLAALADGSHTLAVEATDTAGNADATPASYTWVVDATNPTGSLTAPADGAAVSGTIAVSASSADGGTGVLDAEFQFLHPVNGWTSIGTDTSAAGGYSVSWVTSGVTDGSYDLRAITRDIAGNSFTSPVRTVTVDNTAPTLTLNAPAVVNTSSSDPETLGATATDAGTGVASVLFEQCLAAGATCGAGWVSLGVDTTFPYAVSWPVPTDGDRVVKATATDLAGRSTSQTSVVTIDRTRPAGTITAPAAAANVRRTVALTASASDTAPGAVNTVTFQYSPAGANTWSAISTDSSAPYAASFDTVAAGATDGLYDLRVFTTDAAGNAEAAPATIQVRIDNTDPTGAVTAPVNGANVRGAITLTSNSADAGSGLDTVVFETAPAGSGTWTVRAPGWTTTGVADGLYDIRVTTTDLAGNSLVSPSIAIRVDNTLPTGSVTAPAAAANLSNTVALASNSADAGSGIASVVFEQMLSSGGTWTAVPASWNTKTGADSVADGLYDLRVKTTDLAGNAFTSGSVPVRVDNTAPTGALTQPLAGPAGGTIALVSDSVDAGSGVASAAFRFRASGAPGWTGISTDTSAPYGATLATIGVVADGAYELQVTTTDLAGNATDSAIVAVTVDNTAPTTGAVASPGTLSNAPVTVTLSAADGAGSGVSFTQFSLDGGSTWTTGTNTIVAAPGDHSNDGSHAIKYRSLDVVGNVEATKTITVVIDTTAPSGAPGNPGDYLRGIVALTYTTGATDVASVQFEFSPAAANAWAAIGGLDIAAPYAVDWNTGGGLVTDGAYDLRVVVVDSAGNSSAQLLPGVPKYVDNTAPTGSVTAPAAAAYVSGTIDLDASATDAPIPPASGVSAVSFAVKPSGAGSFSPVGTQTTPIIGSTYRQSWNSSSVPDGPVELQVVVTDVAGNTLTSATRTINVDNDAPTITVDALPANVSNAFTVSATAAADTQQVEFQRRATGTLLWTSIGTDATAPFQTTFDMSVGEGVWEVRAIATDASANTGTSAIVTTRVDKTAPTGTLTAPASAQTIGGTNVALAATAADALAGVASVQFQVQAFGAGSFTTVATDASSPYAATWDATSSADGAAQVRLVVTDAAGNVHTTASTAVTIDSTAPAVTLGDPGALLGGTVSLTATTSGVGATSVVFGITPAGLNSWTSIATDTTAPYSASFDTRTVADGVYELRAIVSDGLGNTNSHIRSAIAIDNTAPSLASSAPADGSTVASASQLVLTASEPVTVASVKLDGAAAPAPAISGNELTFATGALSNGLHVLRGDLVDVRGTHTLFRVAVSVMAPGSSPMPTEKSVRTSGTTILTSSDGGATVSMSGWTAPAGAPGDFPVLQIDPAPGLPGASNLALGSQVYSINAMWAGSEIAMHSFETPLEIIISDSAAGWLIPATSNDGVTWRSLSLLTNGVLAPNDADGFSRAADGIHIYTRHLTYFALQLDTEPPSPPAFGAAVAGDGLTLRWAPGTDNSGQLGHYVLFVNGEPFQNFDLTQSETKMGAFDSSDTRTFSMVETDAAGNASQPSALLRALPQLAGLTVEQARAALAARGFKVGSVVETNAFGSVTGTVVAPAGVRLAASGSAVDLSVAGSSTPHQTQFVFTAVATKRLPLADRDYIAARMKASRPATVTATLRTTTMRSLHKWSLNVKAGVRIDKLHLPLELRRAGNYRLDLVARAGSTTRRQTLKVAVIGPRLTPLKPAKPGTQRSVEVVLVGKQSSAKQITPGIARVNARAIESTNDRTFTLAGAQTRNVGVVVVNVDEVGLAFVRDLRIMFPMIRVLALSNNPGTLGRSVQAGAALALPRTTSTADLSRAIAKLATTSLF